MKNSKRKILIASFSAVLMLMLPLASAVTDTKTVQNLQVQQSKQELSIKANENRRGFLKVIYMIAEDMVQETFLRAWQNFGRFTLGTHFKAWIFQILTYLFLNERRSAQRRGGMAALTWVMSTIGAEHDTAIFRSGPHERIR